MMVVYKSRKLKIKNIVALIMVVLSFFFISESSAEPYYPPYLNDNPNLILVGAREDYGIYYDKTSIVNISYNPPYYKIAVNTLFVPMVTEGNAKNFYVRTHYFTYDYKTRTLDMSLYEHDSGKWSTITNLKPDDPYRKTRGNLKAAELAFFQVYGLKFFDLRSLNYKSVL